MGRQASGSADSGAGLTEVRCSAEEALGTHRSTQSTLQLHQSMSPAGAASHKSPPPPAPRPSSTHPASPTRAP